MKIYYCTQDMLYKKAICIAQEFDVARNVQLEKAVLRLHNVVSRLKPILPTE